METLNYGNYTGYEFRNSLSDKLIINIEGSGNASVLGINNGEKWTMVNMASQLIPLLQDKYTVLVPEKLSRQAGIDYSEDREDRANLTADNLLICYSGFINAYLAEHTYSSIILIGTSEGALLLPFLYERIQNKEYIKGMVAIAGGGLSLYESYTIITTSLVAPKIWKEAAQKYIEIYSQDTSTFPDSIDDGIFFSTYKWHSSFAHLRPFDHYKNINIPVLFVHGRKDYHVAVESTKYVQENLPDKPFEYLYYNNMEHGPGNYFQIIKFRKDITNWIITNDN
jgi:esterase/lipase